MLKRCHLCQSGAVVDLLDCGEQPICNRFLASPDEEEALFPLVLGQCEDCGHVQLTGHPPVTELRPRFDWIVYNEPQSHLGDLVESVARLPGVANESMIGAVVFGDDRTLEQFKGRGFSRTWRIDLACDLGISDRRAGVETLQAGLTPAAADRIVQSRGPSDVLVVRHVLEHTHDLRGFMEAARRLVRPGGYLLFEVPDCEIAFLNQDYSVLWEEHIHYFTPATFRRCFAENSFAVVAHLRPQYSLVAITQPGLGNRGERTSQIEDSKTVRRFAAAFAARRERTKAFLAHYRRTEGNVALFGAGHPACVFINLFGLKDEIGLVVDDNPKKQGLFMPGSRLPVVGSRALDEQKIKLCLSALSRESEPKAFPRDRPFWVRGGRVLSIFPGRNNSLPV